MKKIMYIVGARPNFMKVAPIMREMARYPREFSQVLVHTGQHYDKNMSDTFFRDLGLPKPDVNLEVGSGSHTEQTAKVMQRFEPVVAKYRPDWVVVVGDVNSTLACALVCAKKGIKVAHVEAGLRSFDRTMPEEYNRLLTDQISDLLFTPSRDANVNLRREGIPANRVRLVGNVMIDSLVQLLPEAEKHWKLLQVQMGLSAYVLVTFHRPCNVDDPRGLRVIMSALREISRDIQVVFPVHPRTLQQLRKEDIAQHPSSKDYGVPRSSPPFAQRAMGGKQRTQRRGLKSGLVLLDPLSYLDFLTMEAHAAVVLTDSGGIQEETTYLGVPCLTVRPNTERPVTITHGTNRLIGGTRAEIVRAVRLVLNSRPVSRSRPRRPAMWDGKAAGRIVDVLRAYPETLLAPGSPSSLLQKRQRQAHETGGRAGTTSVLG